MEFRVSDEPSTHREYCHDIIPEDGASPTRGPEELVVSEMSQTEGFEPGMEIKATADSIPPESEERRSDSMESILHKDAVCSQTESIPATYNIQQDFFPSGNCDPVVRNKTSIEMDSLSLFLPMEQSSQENSAVTSARGLEGSCGSLLGFSLFESLSDSSLGALGSTLVSSQNEEPVLKVTYFSHLGLFKLEFLILERAEA